ncbi:unnamed protein product, partial [Urochloa humidicola]
ANVRGRIFLDGNGKVPGACACSFSPLFPISPIRSQQACLCFARGSPLYHLRAAMSGGGGLGAGFSYQKFVHVALEQTRLRTALAPHPSQEKFKFIKTNEENTVFNALSFSAPKIRLLRSLTIEQKNSVQMKDELRTVPIQKYSNFFHRQMSLMSKKGS